MKRLVFHYFIITGCLQYSVFLSHKQIAELLSTYWNMEDVAVETVVYEGTGKKSDSLYYVGDKYVLKFSTSLGKLKNHIIIPETLEKEGTHTGTADFAEKSF